jgi:hypothetical protein
MRPRGDIIAPLRKSLAPAGDLGFYLTLNGGNKMNETYLWQIFCNICRCKHLVLVLLIVGILCVKSKAQTDPVVGAQSQKVLEFNIIRQIAEKKDADRAADVRTNEDDRLEQAKSVFDREVRIKPSDRDREAGSEARDTASKERASERDSIDRDRQVGRSKDSDNTDENRSHKIHNKGLQAWSEKYDTTLTSYTTSMGMEVRDDRYQPEKFCLSVREDPEKICILDTQYFAHSRFNCCYECVSKKNLFH